MATSRLIEVPPLPADTADRWHDVLWNDTEMVQRFLNVLYQLDDHYLAETVATFRVSGAREPRERGAAYFYWTPRAEVVVRFVYHSQRRQHCVMSAGFVGAISPHAALDLIVDRTIQYARERSIDLLYAVPPKETRNPEIANMYDLVPSHPRLKVTTEAESRRARRWRIELPELQSA